MEFSKSLILIYLAIAVIVLSFSVFIESSYLRAKYLISSFGIIAFINMILLFSISYLYSKFLNPAISALNSNKPVISAATLLFIILHIFSAQLFYYNFSLEKILSSPKAPSLIMGMIGLSMFLILLISLYTELIPFKNFIIKWSSYGVIGFILVHFLSMNGFWGENIIVKLLFIIAVIFLLIKK